VRPVKWELNFCVLFVQNFGFNELILRTWILNSRERPSGKAEYFGDSRRFEDTCHLRRNDRIICETRNQHEEDRKQLATLPSTYLTIRKTYSESEMPVVTTSTVSS
jgi:hypothetical protein